MRGNCWFPFPSRTVRSASRCDSDSLLAVEDPKTAFLGFLGFFENRDFWGPENLLRSRSKLLGPFSPNKGDFAVLKGKSGFSFRNPVSPGTPSLPPVFGPPGTPNSRDPRDPAGISRRDLPRDSPGTRHFAARPGPRFWAPENDPPGGPPLPPGPRFWAPPGPPPGGGVSGTPFLGPPPSPPSPAGCAPGVRGCADCAKR